MCASRLILDWWDYGSTIGYRGADLREWAANPSEAGTHWFLVWSELYSPYTTSTLIHQQGEALYENWDFGDQYKDTLVSHDLTLEAHTNGVVYYTANWGASGEFSWLLHSHTFVDTGVY
ncbi:MAG: hypothetical protein QME63_00040 [Actinomycetota bacterium]|nr:hypothetical protein [Actinomycetota bacterium]